MVVDATLTEEPVHGDQEIAVLQREVELLRVLMAENGTDTDTEAEWDVTD